MSDKKVVTSCKLARRLILDGFKVIDIKPHRDNPERTVFLFDNTEQLNNLINQRDESLKPL